MGHRMHSPGGLRRSQVLEPPSSAMLSAMNESAPRRHVVVLAPMPLEMEAVVKAFGLHRAGDEPSAPWTGQIGHSDVTALHIGMGPSVTRLSATACFDGTRPSFPAPDHMMIAGICGGLHPDLEVATLLNPLVVVEHATGASYAHHPPGDRPQEGKLITTDAVTLDHEFSRSLLADGFLGVDMESSAVAEVCEANGCDWSVYRCIGDRYFDGLLDERVVAMARPDGSPDVDAVAKLVAEEPDLLPRLERLAHDSAIAARLAAEAAVCGCLALDRPREGL
jgi:nucleoside phosphorylase